MTVPKKRSVALLKSTILNSAQTSHFEVEIIPPTSVINWIREKTTAGKGQGRIATLDFYDKDLKLACHQAQLPGVSFGTHELNNKYQNATVRNVYRKMFDSSASFTFYVDKEYNMLHFFENWMSYMMDEQETFVANARSSYRAQFPNTYKCPRLVITKFERDYTGSVMRYNFLDAYPSSIDSMEVSYQGSQVLSCTVNFNYTRYATGTTNMDTDPQAVADRAEADRRAENIANNVGANDIPRSIDAGFA